MLYSVRGIVRRLPAPQLAIDVSGVGYLITTPLPTWEAAIDGDTETLVVHTYVREDRLDLFGFKTDADRSLFQELLNLSGIGPKTALEICSIPRPMLMQAVLDDDVASLQEIKGVGRKTAEKLLVDLRQLLEKHPDWAQTPGPATGGGSARYDTDAIAALASLGYDRTTIIAALEKLPLSIATTEARVAAALRSL